MSKRYGKGWSSVRGRATHDYDADVDVVSQRALCGSLIRVWDWELAQVVMRLKKLEACRHCQHARRKRARR